MVIKIQELRNQLNTVSNEISDAIKSCFKKEYLIIINEFCDCNHVLSVLLIGNCGIINSLNYQALRIKLHKNDTSSRTLDLLVR